MELLTAEGCISGRQWPIPASLGDGATKQAIDDFGGYLLLVSEMQDLVIYRSLGLPVTLWTGIDKPDLDLVDELATRLGWDDRDRRQYLGRLPDGPVECADRNESPLPSESPLSAVEEGSQQRPDDEPSHGDDIIERKNGPRLVLPGWSVRERTPGRPDAVAQLQPFLWNVDQDLGVAVDDQFRLWYPSHDNLEQLQVRLTYRVPDAVRASIRESFRLDQYELFELDSDVDQPPPDLLAAIKRLKRVLLNDGLPSHLTNPEDAKTAWRHFEQLLERDVCLPLQRQAAETADPVKANLLMMMAELSKDLRRESVIRDIEIQRSHGNKRTLGDPSQLPHCQSMLQKIDRLLRLARELAR